MDGLAFIDDEQANGLKNVTLQSKDVLLNITGDSVARACMVPDHLLPARVNQHVAIIRADKNKAIPEYILYNLIAQKEELLMQSEIGATRKAITKVMLEQFELNLPPLPEQRAIASVLSSLDDKIDLLHRQNQTLEQMAETLFRQWFVEEADDSWPWQKLEEHIVVHRGLSYNGAGLAEHGDGVPMHNLNSVYEGGGYKYEGIKFYNGAYKERHLIEPGDVIITNTEQGHDMLLIGCSAIVPKHFGTKGIFSQHIYKLEPKSTWLSKPYLHYLILSHDVREQITGSTNGSTVNMLPKDGIEWAKFKKPPEELVRKFTEIVDPILLKKEENYDQTLALQKLRDTLLPKLMSGEVRVRDVEEVIAT